MSSRADAAPVVIAGAGPVGLVTALLLARYDVPTVVLESAARWDPAGSKAICFQRDVLDVLDRVGCAEDLIAEGVTWTVGRTYYRDHELYAVTFPDPGRSAVPPWINISQAVLERRLLDLVAATPLIDLRYGHRVSGVRLTPDGVEVDAGVRVRGSHLVGADGARSTVRQLLGVGFPGQSFPDQFLICDIKAELPFPSERRFYFDPEWNPGRQVLVHHCPESTWRIDWQVPADYDLAAERAGGALDARIRTVVGGVPYEVVWATAYRFHERCAERFAVRGRAFLTGDAAHLYAPFGARGLNSGIQDAENLAWKLAFVRHGWAPPALLDSYHVERRAAAAENLRVTMATMEFLAPQTEAQRTRRRTALDRAVTDAGARSMIDSGKLAEPYWYLDSPLTTPAGPVDDFPRQPGALRPPVPGVLCPDASCTVAGRQTRLRRLFGRSFVVLTAEPPDRLPAVGFPCATYTRDDIDDGGEVRKALPASGYVIRPDGHLAAVLDRPDPPSLAAALHRAAGLPVGHHTWR